MGSTIFLLSGRPSICLVLRQQGVRRPSNEYAFMRHKNIDVKTVEILVMLEAEVLSLS